MPLQLSFDTGLAAPSEAPLRMAVDVFLPPDGAAPRALLWCLPGGNMNRHYYDVVPEDGDSSFSFARTLSRQGYVVATVDYLGLGDSDRPEDGWRCTPEFLTAGNRSAYEQLQARITAGELPGLPARALPSIGVGHSMGAMMTILQQAAHAPHAGVALLGFSTRGLPEYLPEALRAQPLAALREQLTTLTRQIFGEPFARIQGDRESRSIFAGRSADPRAVAALKRAAAPIMAMPACLSMLPGNVSAEAAQIRVPVFLGLGENDMAGPPHAIPAAFTGSFDVQLHLAAGAGHAQFLFASRGRLMSRIDDWARQILS